ncbi:MAG: tyrosine-protein phosphatase [Bacteroidales bacterium]|nr:tyrosine-protein phosphatase [Bacteroidales bacterium]
MKESYIPTFETQKIDLEGVANARELGGYVMQDGRRIRHGLLLRSGTLNTATDDDIRKLHDEFDLRHVFDFRTGYEAAKAPDRVVPGSDNISLPSVDPVDDVWAETPLAKTTIYTFEQDVMTFAKSEQGKTIAKHMYPSLVMSEYTQLQYATFLNYAVNTQKGAILWHCSQGKDRTGLGAAFLLAALGASRELILQDFNISNIFYKPLVDKLIVRLAEEGCGEEEFEVIRAIVGVSNHNFINVLDLIDREFGSMHTYLVDFLCVSEEEIEILCNRYLE